MDSLQCPSFLKEDPPLVRKIDKNSDLNPHLQIYDFAQISLNISLVKKQ